jgi:hypothetical protein
MIVDTLLWRRLLMRMRLSVGTSCTLCTGVQGTTMLTQNLAIPELQSNPLTKARTTMRICDYVFPADWEIGMYPGFDTVELKSKIQAEILRETEGMTDEQVRERRRKLVEQDIRWRAELAKSSDHH